MEIASDKKIVDYSKLKEASSEPNAKFKGKFRHLNCCVKKERKVSRCDNWFDKLLQLVFFSAFSRHNLNFF